jgi:glycosyltransferase involved in cell wall biosynthesis
MDEELNCDFYFGDQLDWAPDILSMDVHILQGFKGTLKNKRIFKFFIWQKGAFHLIFKKYEHYILYGDSFYLSNWLILIFAKILGKKTYLWTHGLYVDLNWKSKLFNFLFYKMATKILLYGNFSRNKMIELGYEKEKLVCIYNSLDYDKQIAIRDKITQINPHINHFKNKNPVIIYIGRIQVIKKLNYILESICELKKEGIGVNFVVIGEDKEGVDLPNSITALNITENVWLFGPCYKEDTLAELIYHADVCISPGNIGLTAVHSLTYGTPAITHSNYKNQMPEFEAIESGITGDFFIENDVFDLKQKITKWINLDVSRRNFVRKKCFEMIDNRYNPNYQINVFKSLVND